MGKLKDEVQSHAAIPENPKNSRDITTKKKKKKKKKTFALKIVAKCKLKEEKKMYMIRDFSS